VSNYFVENRDKARERLIEWLRIPSISTLPEHKGDLRKAAEFAIQELKTAGLENAELIESKDRNPLVYADWLHAPGKPTLLFYGHYDVQPPDPLDEWKSPPFEPAIRNDNIYARGASDDKGQTYILIKAVEAVLKMQGKLPCNVKFILEGEEEVGGEHLEEYVASKPPKLASSAAIICDTEMFAPELPTICVGLRGMIYTEVFVQGPDHDLHSGIYGGAAPNPFMALAEILTELKARDGHVRIPGFYDRVRPPSLEEQEAWNRLPFNEEEYRKKEVGSTELTGEPGYSVFERTWARPTFEVHGIRGGFTGEGAKTVIPARAIAKVSMRLVPDQRPEEVLEQFKAAVAKATPRGVTSEVKLIHGAEPSVVDPNNDFIRAAAVAMEQVFGNKTVYIRSGGSIPIVGSFLRSLGIPSVMMGFGLPDDNLHSPNEKFYLPNFYRGIEAVARFIELVGKS
jgi:acetylornithine deacetylase/succinyl-diaminopimelate desuccinylase-like protein